MPLGFGNAIVLQTMFSQFYIIIVILLDGRVMLADFFFFILVALVSHLPESQMAVGTGFAQLLRGLGSLN